MKSREWQLNWKNNINFDWMIKLNTNKTLTKDLGVEITNQKNKGWIGENNIWHKKNKIEKMANKYFNLEEREK
jgi:ribosomal protein L31